MWFLGYETGQTDRQTNIQYSSRYFAPLWKGQEVAKQKIEPTTSLSDPPSATSTVYVAAAKIVPVPC